MRSGSTAATTTSSTLFEGRGNVAAGIRSLAEGTTQTVIQMNDARALHVEGERATARSTIQEFSLRLDGTSAVLFATYNDDLVREQDSEWRFAKRHIQEVLRGDTTVT
jgi:hypothetical protein